VATSNEEFETTDASTPALSVVMPVYNVERFIDEAIDSVLGQTFTDLELVIVDDASTDSTWDIVTKRAVDEPRIRLIRNEKNVGAAAAANAGIRAAFAPLIARMDGDDVSVATRFEKQVATLNAHPHFAVVGTFASHINEHGQLLSLSGTGPTTEAEFDNLRRAGKPTMVFGGTALFARDLFERIGGYNPVIRIAEDLELFDRMADEGPVIAIPEPLLLYRLHPDSTVERTFLEGRRVHRFVAARRQAQNSGQKTMDLEQFIEWERKRPLWPRLRDRLQDGAQYHYRKAGLAFGRGDKTGLVWNLLRAFLARPLWVARRLWCQKLSPKARASGSTQV